MADKVSIVAADGHNLEAWRARSAGEARGGIVLLHAIYGLTSHLGDVCDRFAAEGYEALAPALYDRTEPGTLFGYDPDGAAAAMAFRENLTEDGVCHDVAACAASLRDDAQGVAVSGFCTGGTWAWIAAGALEFDAAVIFYGSDVYENLERSPRCPTLLHYGDNDHVVPIDRVMAIRDRYPFFELHVYPGAGHAFFNPEQNNHDPRAAALAFERSLDFLGRTLPPS